jgi:hypothetical protein
MVKTLMLYLVLVGVPVVGVSTVIRVGNRLTPPVALAGKWQLEARPDLICVGAVLDTLATTIEQSGRLLEVWFDGGGPRLKGSVEGIAFAASHGETMRFSGTLHRDGGNHLLEGVLSGSPCAAATRTVVLGTRLSSPGQQPRGH